MIPYEELVSALSRWRARQGLPSGPGDYLGEPAQRSHDSYVPTTAAAAAASAVRVSSRPSAVVAEDVLDVSDEMFEDSAVGAVAGADIETAEYETASEMDTHDDPMSSYDESPMAIDMDLPVAAPAAAVRKDTETDGRGGGKRRR